MLRCDLDLWPLNICTVCRLWRGQILYQMWVKSNNPRRSIMAISIFDHLTLWPWTCVTCCALPWDDFQTVQTQLTYPFVICHNCLMSIRYVTLWPELWPVDLEHLYSTSVVTTCSKSVRSWANLNNPRLSYSRFSKFFFQRVGGRTFKLSSSEGVGQTAPNLERKQSSIIAALYFGLDVLLRLEMRAAQIRVVYNIEGKFHTFDSPCENLGRGGGECWARWSSRHYMSPSPPLDNIRVMWLSGG